MNNKEHNNKNIIVLVTTAAALVLLLVAGIVIYNNKGDDSENSFHVVEKNEPTTETATENGSYEADENEAMSENAPENIEYAPDFTVYDHDGKEVKLSENFGKPVVFNFWATWCGPCKSEMPGFENLYKKYRDKVVFMMINSSDSRQDVDKFLKQNGYTFPIYYDDTGEASYTYNVSAIPATYVTDKYGQIYGYQIGVLPEEALEKAIKTVLGEE